MNQRTCIIGPAEVESGGDIPLLHTELKGELLDAVGHFQLRQHFANLSGQAAEILYVFPIDADAAVTGFRIETEGRVIEGSLEEKEKAFESYAEAMDSGDAAYLLEQEGRDILSLNLGNIAEGQGVTVTVDTMRTLPLKDGELELLIPTSFAPRYAGPGSDPLRADRLTPGWMEKVPYGISLELRFRTAVYAGAECDSHALEMQEEMGATLLRFKAETVSPDRDIVIRLQRCREEGRCYIGRHSNGTRAAYLQFSPEFGEEDVHQDSHRLYLFVLDRSGSMDGSSIDTAKKTLDICLRQLDEGDRFNIIYFGSHHRMAYRQPLEASPDNIKNAMKALKKVEADMGGTDMTGPLDLVLHWSEGEESPPAVFLLTDGQVFNEDLLLEKIRQASAQPVFFCLGIGSSPAHGFLKDASETSGGMYESVKDSRGIQRVVLRQFARSRQPFLRDIRISSGGMKFRKILHDRSLFEGDSWFASALLEGSVKPEAETVTVKARFMDGRRLIRDIPVVDLGDEDLPARFWALRHIRSLPISKSAGQMKEELELSLRYQVLTPATAFVAVQLRDDGERILEERVFQRVPLQMTASMNTCYSVSMDMGVMDALMIPGDAGSSLLKRVMEKGMAYFGPNMERPQLGISRKSRRKSSKDFDSQATVASGPEEILGFLDPEGFFSPDTRLFNILGQSRKSLKPAVEILMQKLSDRSGQSDSRKPHTGSDGEDLSSLLEKLLLSHLCIQWFREQEGSNELLSLLKKAETWLEKTLNSLGLNRQDLAAACS